MSSHTSVSIEPLAEVLDHDESFLYYTIEVEFGTAYWFCRPPWEEEFAIFDIITASLVDLTRNRLFYIRNTLAITPMQSVFFFISDSIFAYTICFDSIVSLFVFFFDFFFNIFLLKVSLFVALSVEVEEEKKEYSDVGANKVGEARCVLTAWGEVRPCTVRQHQDELDL